MHREDLRKSIVHKNPKPTTPIPTTREKEETLFKARDVRLLRERLAWIHKRSPVEIKDQINETLISFAMTVKEYCKCEEQVFISIENKSACLNCGTRHDISLNDPKLETLK